MTQYFRPSAMLNIGVTEQVQPLVYSEESWD